VFVPENCSLIDLIFFLLKVKIQSLQKILLSIPLFFMFLYFGVRWTRKACLTTGDFDFNVIAKNNKILMVESIK
jgi:hypothetical protein